MNKSNFMNYICNPKHYEYYQEYFNRLLQYEINGIDIFIEEIYRKVSSKEDFISINNVVSDISCFDAFWINSFQFWIILRQDNQFDKAFQFSLALKRLSINSSEAKIAFQWTVFEAIYYSGNEKNEIAINLLFQAFKLLFNDNEHSNIENYELRKITNIFIDMIDYLMELSSAPFVNSYLDSLLEFIKSINNFSQEVAFAVGSIGEKLLDYQNVQAIFFLELAAEIFRSNNNFVGLVSVLTDLGAAYHDIGISSEKGLEISLEAVDIAEKNGLKNHVHAIFDVGNILLNMGRGSEAEGYFRKAIELGKEFNEYQEVVHSMRALARQCSFRGLVPQAIDLFEEAISIGSRENIIDATRMAYAEFSDLLVGMGNFNYAIKALEQSLLLAKKENNAWQVKDYTTQLTDLITYVQDRAVAFQIIRNGQWKTVVFNKQILELIPEIIEKANNLESIIPYWDLEYQVYIRQSYEKEILAILSNIEKYRKNKEIKKEIENRISLALFIFDCVILKKFKYTLDDWFKDVKENNLRLSEFSLINDPILIAGILFSTIFEQIISCSIGLFSDGDKDLSRDYEEIHSSAGKRLKETKVSIFESNPEIQKLIIKAIEFLDANPEEKIVKYILSLIRCLPISDALQILQLSIYCIDNKAWAYLIVREIDHNCTPEEILPSLSTLAIDLSLKAEHRLSIANLLGERKIHIGQFDEGIACLEEVILEARKISDTNIQIDSLFILGMTYRQLGDYKKAINYYDDAIDLARTNNLHMLGVCLHRKGNLLFDMMDFPQAKANFYEALDIYLQETNINEMAYIFDNLANISLVEKKENHELFLRKRAMDLAEWANGIATKAVCSIHLGNYYIKVEKFSLAEKFLIKALDYYLELGRGDRVSYVENAIGKMYGNKGNPAFSKTIAKKHIMRALKLAKKYKVVSQEIDSLQVYSELIFNENPSKALKYLNRAIILCQKIPDYLSLITLSKIKVTYLLHMKMINEIPIVLKNVILTIDTIIPRYANNLDFHNFISEKYASFCELAAYFSFLFGDNVQGFEYTEKGKSVEFRKLLSRCTVKGVENELIPNSLIDKESELLNSLNSIETIGSYQSGRNASKLNMEHINSQEKLQNLWTEIDLFSPGYSMMRNTDPIKISELNRILNKSKNINLIQFLFPDNIDDGVIILFNQKRGLSIHNLDYKLNRELLKDSLNCLQREVFDYEKGTDVTENWQKNLFPIIDFISENIPEGEPIILVAHNELYLFPLHSIIINSQRLIERNPISYLPFSSALKFSRNNSHNKSSLVVGSVFEEEANIITQILNADKLIGNKATENNVRMSLPNYGLIHFSCHGNFNKKNPLLSGIQLAGEDFLTADSILQLKLDSPLIVLSACQTGYVNIQPGDYLQGLTQSFLVAGASTIISSLWSIEDRATIEFMKIFYKYYFYEKNDSITALQKTQIEMLHSECWSNPYYWAAFIANSVNFY